MQIAIVPFMNLMVPLGDAVATAANAAATAVAAAAAAAAATAAATAPPEFRYCPIYKFDGASGGFLLP